LCVDALSGEEFFRLSQLAKTEDISLYFAQLCLDCVELGFDKLCILLDNNPTHKQKMQTQLMLHLQQMGLSNEITVEFLYLPSYSPKLNGCRVCDSPVALKIPASFTAWHNVSSD
jgi:hypothetical protein